MQRRPSIVLATRVELEAAFETGEAAAVEVVFDALPWIERIPSSLGSPTTQTLAR